MQNDAVLTMRGIDKQFPGTKALNKVDFTLRKGEIHALMGENGAGKSTLIKVLTGVHEKDGGSIWVEGVEGEAHIHSPQDAVKNGIGYLSEDRKRYGVVVQKTVSENTTMASLERYIRSFFIDKKAEKETAEDYVGQLSIKTPSVDQLVVNLSGGNQQKVVLAKWLVRNCDILIFDEPTRGIDVGAKSEIYKLMNELAQQGKSIIMISSEMTEILRMSDRILVMCEGKKTGEIAIEDATQEAIMNLATRDVE